MSTHEPLTPIPGHHLTVTRGPVRTHTDCTCDNPPQTVHASTRNAERAALRHYITHAPDGPEKTRAQQLLDQIATRTTTTTKEKTA